MDYPTLTALVAISSLDEVQVILSTDKIKLVEIWKATKPIPVFARNQCARKALKAG